MSARCGVDTIVIGGGPAGISTALSLMARGESVMIVERSSYTEPRIGETFPPAINHVLARLGLGDALAAVPRVSSVGVRCVWRSADPFDRSYLFDPYGNGCHADRRPFDPGLPPQAKRRGPLRLPLSIVRRLRARGARRRAPRHAVTHQP